MPTCAPPVYAVGGPYQDATCGVPTCGFAITAMWWVYPCAIPYQLDGVPPGVTAASGISVTITAPQAQATLAAALPVVTAEKNASVAVTPAQMTLTAALPGFKLSQALPAPPGELDLLAGPTTIRFVGQVWLWPTDCDEIALAPATCTEVVLVAAACTETELEPLTCR